MTAPGATVTRRRPEGFDPVVRLKAPQDGETVVDDMVQGRVVIPNKDLDDFVLLRSDGTPTYMLAVVVDDHDMGITHIIRGDDHLTNAARQTLIFEAIGWDVPAMAHIPLIHGPDGAKLSKRHGATGAEAYRAMGYLPQAMRNYLARLGWSHGDEEIMSLDDMIRWFGMDAVGQSAARFDFKKLENLNGHYMRSTDDAELLEHWKVYLAHADNGAEVLGLDGNAGECRRCSAALPGLKERAKTLVELTDSASYLWRQRPLDTDEKPPRSSMTAPARSWANCTLCSPWFRLVRGAAGDRGQGLCGRQGPQARQGRPAPARSTDRPWNLPGNL
jgi:glutamyl-tRNA synthetase